MEEIIRYLAKRNDYIVWAGFAQYAHLGLKASHDIDIYVRSAAVKKSISGDFQKNGWKKGKKSKFYVHHDKLEKSGTTFDIVYSGNARLFFNGRMKKFVKGYSLCFVSREVLFLSKLGLMTVKDRSMEKRLRDWKAVNALRKGINAEKLRNIASKLPDSYWSVGWV